MKSRRLKNFCEVCRKQCKDENGYHCHLNSGHHQKRLRQLATNPQEHIEKYSSELQGKIIQILKTKYPGEPKDIQDLYEQYAQDKHYVKFTYTRWRDLSQFIEHLRTNVKNITVTGKLPYCKVTYVVSKAGDFMKKKRQQEIFHKKQKEKEANEKKLQERIARLRESEAQRYKKHRQEEANEEIEQIDLDNHEFVIDLQERELKPSIIFNPIFQKPNGSADEALIRAPRLHNAEKLLNEIQLKEKGQNKQKEEQQFEWIMPGIIVKILPHEIPQAFIGKKSEVIAVKQPFVAQIKVGSANLSIDQTYLETVIPKIGNQVVILKGKHRGTKVQLKQINIEQGFAVVDINGKPSEYPFSQISKSS